MSLISRLRTVRSINRIREIALILSKHGFNQLIEAAGLARLLPISRRFRGRSGAAGETPAPVQLRMALEDLGPTFIKLGQMLAARPDLVPSEYVEEFKKLQDEVPPFPFAEARRILEEETGGPLERTFARVDPEPLAAASIAQVHRALLADGTRVVCKIRRPGIERTVSQDLATLYLVVGLAERYLPETRPFHLRQIVDEFARTIRRELDLFLEAANTERFHKDFADFEGVVVPAVHWEFTTRKLLVLDAVEGDPADDRDALEARGIDPKETADLLARAFLYQVFDKGLFHGDLHAGNLLVTPDGRLAMLDFGAVGYLSEDLQEALGHLFVSLIGRDYGALADGYLHLGVADEPVDIRAFQRDLLEFIEPYYGRPLKDLRLGAILREASQIAVRHRLRVPPDLILLARSLLTVEGIARSLDPEFQILDLAAPYARKLLMRRLDPRRQSRRLARAARDLREFAQAVPSQVTQILQKMIESKFAVDFVHKGYEPMLDEMDRSTNRLSFSLVISALIIGSSLIVLSGRGPLLWEFPVLGIFGFLLAGVLGFGLAIAILRSGKF
ncbi:MAG: AarF/UbiB family protein [Deferrisomatales bacterium]